MLTFTKMQDSFTLTGNLDEHAARDLAGIERALDGATTIRLDLAAITTANSPGIAAWSLFVRDLTKRTAVEFHRCPSVMVDYANVLPATFGDGEVVSFFAPLRCAACSHTEELLVPVKDLRSHDAIPGADKPCAKCRKSMSCEVEPESLLAFLSDLGAS